MGAKDNNSTAARALGVCVRALASVPAAVLRWFAAIGKMIAAGVRKCALAAADTVMAFVRGNFVTKLSFFIMGLWGFVRGAAARGAAFLAAEAAYILYMIFFGARYLAKFSTLGTSTQGKYFDEKLGIYLYSAGDNSVEILLFGTMTVIITVVFIAIWCANGRAAANSQRVLKSGGRMPTLAEDIRSLTGKNYHITLLALPTLLVTFFTVLPLIFMVLMAFTNFDKAHQPPGNLFTWVGLENFGNILGNNEKITYTFIHLLGWTIVWAVFSTFTNYIFGMLLALMINKRSIKFKKGWRMIFIVTIAVPQFVTLLLMSQMLHSQGAVNVILKEAGIIDTPIGFLTDTTLARISVIVINMWIGIPYSMLITSGILSNIPEDMYEAAKIDGASPATVFFKITLPYMLFVTTPYLITQFVGNINNFNIIYLLTQGGPLSLDYYQAGKTDLLVTWLYKQTVNEQNYNLASVIGIAVFVITSVASLIVYNHSVSVTKEEQFS